MRSILFCTAMLAATPALADWDDIDYSERRKLALEPTSIGTLRIDAGAGSMHVRGAAGESTIEVEALIRIDGAEGDKAKALIEDRMRLSLTQRGDDALLIADFKNSMRFDGNAGIDLEIVIPEGMGLDIKDGSGSIVIGGTEGRVVVNDGSGSIQISNVADLVLDDGSGSIRVANVSGDVSVNDGSGSITIQGVSGNVSIDDGSGSIDVSDIGGDFVVADDGSGGVNFHNVIGSVSVIE